MNVSKKSVLIVGEQSNNAFVDILERCRIPYRHVRLEAFAQTNLQPFHSILFMPGYFEWGANMNFKERTLRKLQNFRTEGGSCYAEFVQSDDYVLRNVFLFKHNSPPREVAYERTFVSASHPITGDFPLRAILPVRNCSFLPGYSKTGITLLAFGTVLGAHKVLYGLPERRAVWPALLALRSGHTWCGYVEEQSWVYATFELSRYVEKNFPLQKQWEKIVRRILLYLLPESQRKLYGARLEPFDVGINKKTWSTPGTPVVVSVPEKDKIAVAVTKGARVIRTGEKSYGITKKISFKPETSGIYTISIVRAGIESKERVEAISREKKYRQVLDRLIRWYFESGVMPKRDGTRGVYEGFRSSDHKLIPVYRSECNAEAATAIYMYGQLTGAEKYKRIGENILSFLFRGGFQDMNKKRATYGLWKFFDELKVVPNQIWSSGNSWVASDLFLFHRWTRKRDYLRRALLTAEKFLELEMHERIAIAGVDLNAQGLEKFCRLTKKTGPDRFVPAFYAYAAGATGDKKYLKIAKRMTEKLILTIKSDPYFFRSLVTLYGVTKEPFYKSAMSEMLNTLDARQLSCGAIKSLPNEKHTRTGYGLAEVGVMHRASDPVVDQLYENAAWAYALCMAHEITGEESYLKVFHKLMDFLARIQIVSSDPRLNGAWMRAFDYEYWDYYGSNGDIDWGPYCIESGWSNAWTGRALALYLMKDGTQAI
ncbi:MAG: hypothetical protein JXN60_00485 [Lentisphaerae bacterium]|nr:hypothetical protein [Lentisphaerota bacterium]